MRAAVDQGYQDRAGCLLGSLSPLAIKLHIPDSCVSISIPYTQWATINNHWKWTYDNEKQTAFSTSFSAECKSFIKIKHMSSLHEHMSKFCLLPDVCNDAAPVTPPTWVPNQVIPLTHYINPPWEGGPRFPGRDREIHIYLNILCDR